jgi:hypothetical protein
LKVKEKVCLINPRVAFDTGPANESAAVFLPANETMSGIVKGCKTPALSRRPVSLNENSTGRCLTSLEGGNRGMLRCGHFSVQGYGDLSVVFSVRIDRATDY